MHPSDGVAVAVFHSIFVQCKNMDSTGHNDRSKWNVIEG